MSGKIKSRPILFTGEMVRAILDGAKRQTRRIVKPQPPSIEAVQEISGSDYRWMRCDDMQLPAEFRVTGPVWAVRDRLGFPQRIKCPYGAPGDLLWVRERCRAEELQDGTDGVRYAAEDHFQVIENTQEAADRWVHLHRYGKGKGRSVPSIHMPKWASRITLKITDVRVERVNDISEADAMSEGYPGTEIDGKHVPWSPYGWFMATWQTINGEESWAANPWTWVISFSRVVEG